MRIFFIWSALMLEVGAISFLQPLLGRYASPVVFTASAVLLAFLLLQNLQAGKIPERASKLSATTKCIFFLLSAAIIWVGWLWMRHIFPQYPIDPSQSDIIPSIEIYTKRFAQGSDVYRDFSDFGYTISPTYLPGMWVPFVVADVLLLDYRTWAYGIFWVCLLLLLFLVKPDLKKGMLLFALPFLFILLYLYYHPEVFGWTVETMIAGFYLLLVAGLFSRKTWLIGLAVVGCLLSRYALVLLLPFLFFLYWRFAGPVKTLQIVGLSVAGVLFFFIVPFFVHHPQLLAKGYQYYTQAAMGEWQGQSWQKPGELPYQLSQQFGFALFFYNRTDVAGSLHLYQYVHKIVSIAVPFCFAFWYFVRGNKWLPLPQFLLLLVHIYLVFFFAFIQVPYAYLFLTPAMVSIVTTLLVVKAGK